MKYIFLMIVTLFVFSGCSSKQEPTPKVEPEPAVVAKVETPKPVYHAPRKKGVVPPLPKREEDIDVDSAVDSAMGDIPS